MGTGVVVVGVPVVVAVPFVVGVPVVLAGVVVLAVVGGTIVEFCPITETGTRSIKLKKMSSFMLPWLSPSVHQQHWVRIESYGDQVIKGYVL